MAQFYKPKRRKAPGPSKNEIKVRRGMEADQMARSAGLLKDRFPFVQKLSIQLDFLTPQGHLMDQQTRVFNPPDACDFAVSCPGRCGRGSFDLAAKVRAVLESRQGRSDSSGTCAETLYPGSKEICGFNLRCRMEAMYVPQPKE